MKLSAYVRYADDASDETIIMPTGDDAELTVRVFGIVIRDGMLPDMTQTLSDGSKFTVHGGGRLLSEVILSWDHSDDPAPDPSVPSQPDPLPPSNVPDPV